MAILVMLVPEEIQEQEDKMYVSFSFLFISDINKMKFACNVIDF